MVSEKKDSGTTESIKDLFRRVSDAQIAFTEGVTKTTIEGSKKVFRSSSDAVSTGLEGLLNGWSKIIQGGTDAVNEGMNGLIDGSSTALKCFQTTLEDVTEILGEKKPRERKPEQGQQSKGHRSGLHKANPEVLRAKAKKAGISGEMVDRKLKGAQKHLNKDQDNS